MKYIITESQMTKIVRRLNEESSREKKVKKIQKFLISKPYEYDLGDYGENEDGVDGKYGTLTKKAVEKFQRKKGFEEEEIDGLVGPDTAAAMGGDIEPVFKKKSEMSKSDETEKEDGKEDETEKEDDYSGLKGGKVKLVGNFSQEQKNNIKFMIDYMESKGLKDPLAQIGALSVISKECNFIPKSEVPYNTTANSHIRKVFGNRVPKDDKELDKLKKNPQAFFNQVYKNKNGNIYPDDGYKYRGRGFNQLTGRGNYKKYGGKIGKDLVSNPELVNNREIAAQVAVEFFTKGKITNIPKNFKNKKEAAIHFADINSGGGVSSHRTDAINASRKFDVEYT
jgi:predicted chitinase